MRARSRQILREALLLPPKARADIAGTLLRSLDIREDPGVEEAWAKELERRLADVDSGRVKLVPWGRVRGNLRASLRRAGPKD